MKISDSLKEDIADAPNWFHQAIEAKLEQKKYAFNGHEVAYQKWNIDDEKQLTVLIHGTGAHSKWWDPIAPLLKSKGTIIAPELPGMGDTSHFDKYNFELFKDAVLGVIGGEGMLKRKIFLVGHSLGGHLAAYIASEMPELVSGLIIIDSPIRPPDYDYDKHISSGPLRPIKYYSSKREILSRFRLMPPQECKNDWYLRFIAEFSIKETSDGWRWKFDDRLFRSLKRLDGYGFSFSCPALFISGSDSLLLGSKIMKYMQSAFSEIMEFKVIKDAAHHVLVDKPLELAELINMELKKWN